MASDNTLGAPTEGLGQTVTFTSQTTQAPQAQGARRGSLRAGQQGDGGANLTQRPVAIQDAREGAAVLDVFRKLGNDILAPRLEAARNDAFLTGMQRAAGGEAVNEIVKEQPWYSQIFGETPVVEGARAWSASAKAQEEALALESDMPNLRAKSPTEVKNLLNQRISAIQTGDRNTDALVVQSLIKELPSIMRRHTKEHIAWQQANYANDFRNSRAVAADRLRATMAAFNPDDGAKPKALLEGKDPGAVTDRLDITEAQIAFAQSFVKPVGLPQETYDTLTTGTVLGLLNRGNLHAYYTLEDSGIIASNLSVESQIKLQNAVDRAETAAQRELPMSIIDEIAQIKAIPVTLTGDVQAANKEINERVAKLNAAYTAITGSRRAPISGSTLIEVKNSVIDNYVRDVRKAEEEWKKAGDNYAKQQSAAVQAANLLLTGGSVAGLPSDQVRLGWESLRADKSPEGQMKLGHARRLAVVSGTVDQVGANVIKQDAKRNFDTDNVAGWHKLYVDEWLPLSHPGDISAAKAYFGDHFDNMTYYANRVAGTDPTKIDPTVAEAAFLLSKQPRPKPAGTKEDRKKWAGAITSVAENTHPSGIIFGKHDLLPHVADALAIRLAPAGAEMGEHIPVKDRAKVALQEAQRRGLELAGGYFFERPPGAPPFLTQLQSYGEKPIASEYLNGAISATVNKFIDELELDPADHSVIYQYRNGVPGLTIIASKKEGGQIAAWPVTLQDIYSTFQDTQKTGQERAADEFLNSPDIRDSATSKAISAAGRAVLSAATAVKETRALPISPAILRQREEDERRAAARRNQQ